MKAQRVPQSNTLHTLRYEETGEELSLRRRALSSLKRDQYQFSPNKINTSQECESALIFYQILSTNSCRK